MFAMFGRTLRKISLMSALAFLIGTTVPLFVVQNDAFARRGGGGRGGGGGGRGGGGFSGGGGRGGGYRGGARPSTQPSARPSGGVSTRPGGGGGGTSTANRPSTRPGRGGAGTANRPSNGNRVEGGRTNIGGGDRDRDIDRDRNTNIDIDGDYGHGDYGHGDDWDWEGFATGLVVGAMVTSIPSSGCTTVMVNGVACQSCGGVVYQPVYSGTSVQYKVVEAPQ